VCEGERLAKSHVMTFTIKERPNTEIFMDLTATLYIRETRHSCMTNKKGQRNERPLLEGYVYLVHNCYVNL